MTDAELGRHWRREADRLTAELAKSREQCEMLAQESAASLMENERLAAELSATKAELAKAKNQRQCLVDLATNVCALNGGDGAEAAIAELARSICYPGY